MADRAMVAGTAKPKVIIVTGPTAVGKTKIGLELAKRLGGEVISADSVQVHTGLDIGSDKASYVADINMQIRTYKSHCAPNRSHPPLPYGQLPESQRQGVPHHLIDVLPPTAEFSAGEFYEVGRRATADIIRRGKVPIVVGGTGFYLRWFMYGKAQTPQSSPELRAKVASLIQEAWAKAAEAAAATAALAPRQEEAEPVAPWEQHKRARQQREQAQQGDSGSTGSAGDGVAGEAGGPTSTSAAEHPQILGELQREQQQEQQQQEQQQAEQQWGTKEHHRQWRAQCKERRRAAREAAPPTPEQLADRNMPPDPPANLSREQLWDSAVGVVVGLGDPDAAERVRAERHNWYRLQRVCQILLQNGGKRMSEMDVDTEKELDYDFRCFFLHRPRRQLYDKIAYRVEEMVAGGLLREARWLMSLGVTAGSCNAARAIGYRQALEFMQEAQQQGGAATREQLTQMILKIGAATRKLVKNQHTWFRDDGAFLWVDNSAPEEDVLRLILGEIEKPEHQGNCGDSGRLDKEAARAMREYIQPLVLFKDQQRVARALAEARELLGGGGGGGGGEGGEGAGAGGAGDQSGATDGSLGGGTEGEPSAARGGSAASDAPV